MKKNKALFAVSSLGLGHATRTLVIINHFLEKGYEIDIISFGNNLNLFKTELISDKIGFIEHIDYPPLLRGKGLKFYLYLVIDIIKTNHIIKKEKKFIKTIENNYDFIFSDGKYGTYSKKIPSFLLTHQISFIMPKGLNAFSKISDYFNFLSLKKFHHIFIPDYKEFDSSLAGNLSHPSWVDKLNHSYIGILSSFHDSETEEEEKIDYLFTITGYLFEDKDNFVNRLIEESKKIDGRKVFILGDTKKTYKKVLENNITIYSFVGGEQKKQFFKNADIIISRAGYTTIMDLVELEKKAILFPTPNQTEQEYLVKFFKKNKLFVIGKEDDNLQDLIYKVKYSNIYNTKAKTKNSLLEIEKIFLNHI